MRRARRFGLFWQISLYGVALLVALALAVSGLTRLIRPRSVFAEMETLEHAIDPAGSQPPDARQARAILERYPNWAVTLYDADGTVLANTAPTALPLPPLDSIAARPGSRAYVENPERQAETLHHGRHLVIALSPFRVDQRRITAILLAAVAAVILLLALPVARWMTSPIERLTGTLRALGEGQLDARARLRAPGEVGELASAFDEMADRLQAMVRSERALVANVSHELRTPIARMRVALELALAKGAVRAVQSIEEIAYDLSELERLVEDLLSVARLDLAAQNPSGGLPMIRRERLELTSVLADCATRFRGRFPERTLEVELPASAEVEGDRALLERAVDNLLDNARKYSSGCISMIATSGENVEVRIVDRGEGMSPEALAQVFTPFFRADPSRARETGGVGLGLALTQRIAEALGGRVTLQSAPGVGTTACLSLPRPAAAARTAP